MENLGNGVFCGAKLHLFWIGGVGGLPKYSIRTIAHGYAVKIVSKNSLMGFNNSESELFILLTSYRHPSHPSTPQSC